MIRRVVFALIVGGTIASGASAQDTPSSMLPPVPLQSPAVYASPQAPPIVTKADVPPPPPTPAVLPRSKDEASAAAQKSITRQNPLPPRPTALRASSTKREALSDQGEFANPGGVGRHPEYYTPYTPMGQAEPHPVRVAGFDRGGGPNRAEQIAAFRAGQMRARNIQNNINAYGRPYGAYGAGFGFGLGLGVGRGFGGPN